MSKLLVLVPYRDRVSHLSKFLPAVTSYLKTAEIDATIVIVEQSDQLPFNRGALLNAGFLVFQADATYLCFHDVDCLPIVSDYSYQPNIALLNPKRVYNNWFSSVITCPVEIFKEANGFSNEYWGWGSEDADFFLRTGKKFRLLQGSKYEELYHEHSSLLNNEVRPECLKNHERLRAFSGKQEGLSTCKFEVAVKPYMFYSSPLVKVFNVKIDLSCLQTPQN